MISKITHFVATILLIAFFVLPGVSTAAEQNKAAVIAKDFQANSTGQLQEIQRETPKIRSEVLSASTLAVGASKFSDKESKLNIFSGMNLSILLGIAIFGLGFLGWDFSRNEQKLIEDLKNLPS